MTIFPASLVMLVIWLFLMSKRREYGITLVIATLPLGMFAAVLLGSMSILITHLLAMLTIGVFLVSAAIPVKSGKRFQVSAAGLAFILFAAYSVFSGTVLVRLFSGSLLVFPVHLQAGGIPVSNFFLSSVRPLAPSNSNISQMLYVVLSCGFFVIASEVFRRHGTGLGERGFVIAGAANAIFGLLGLVHLDFLLSVVRTADYSLLDDATQSGFSRIVGAFSEASIFGATSAGFFSYFTMSFLIRGRPLDAVLGAANLAFAILSLSSSGFAAIGAAVFFFLLQMRVYVGRGVSGVVVQWMIVCAMFALAIGCVLFVMTPLGDLAEKLFTDLILNKGASQSALERGAWAQSGIDTFIGTWGLGAGAGSLRSSGYLSVLAGNVGLPGIIAFGLFLWFSFGMAPAHPDPDRRRIFYSSRIAGLTYLVSMLLSATVIDPNMFLVTLAAMACGAVQMSEAHNRSSRMRRFPRDEGVAKVARFPSNR